MGMTAYKLVKVKSDQASVEAADKAKDDSHDLIVQSNLLSGGIEHRFINTFSQETQSQMMDLVKISGD